MILILRKFKSLLVAQTVNVTGFDQIVTFYILRNIVLNIEVAVAHLCCIIAMQDLLYK